MTNLTVSKLKMFQNWVHKCQKRMPRLRKGQWKKKKRKRKVLDCGKKSLLSGNLNRHRGSKNCTSKKLLKQKSENLKSILADPGSSSSAINIALNKVKEYSAKKVPKQISEQRQQDLALELKGSTQRRVANKRKATRLTEEKKEIMDKCFDSGVKRESAYVYSSTLPERNGKRNWPWKNKGIF